MEAHTRRKSQERGEDRYGISMDEDEYDMDNADAFSDTSDEAIDEAMQVALSHNVSGEPVRAQLEALALVQPHVIAQARAQSEG